jgi:hypothetical protein
MSRGPYTFRKSDVRRAIDAVRSAGLSVGRVEVDRFGKIIMIIGEPTPANDNAPEVNEWDEVLQ